MTYYGYFILFLGNGLGQANTLHLFEGLHICLYVPQPCPMWLPVTCEGRVENALMGLLISCGSSRCFSSQCHLKVSRQQRTVLASDLWSIGTGMCYTSFRGGLLVSRTLKKGTW